MEDWLEDVFRLRVVRSDYYGTGATPGNGVFLLEQSWKLLPIPTRCKIATRSRGKSPFTGSELCEPILAPPMRLDIFRNC